MIYGYCRISKKQQNIERQERNIKSAYPDAVIIKEAFTGTKINRPEWNKLFKGVREGDTIVFDSVSRMSRNAEEGIGVYFDLYNKGVKLCFLKEPHINTEVYRESASQSIDLTGNEIADAYIQTTNKVLKMIAERQIKLAFSQSEKEVSDLHQRTKEGIATAKLNGKQIGRAEGSKVVTKKSIEAKKQIKKYSADFEGTLNDIDCMKLIGVSRNTYYKYKGELKAEA